MATNETAGRGPDIDGLATLQAWLRTTSPGNAHAIGLRAALRTLPLVGYAADASSTQLPHEQSKGLILQSFRACFISWVVGKYPGFEIADAADTAAVAAARAAIIDSDIATSSLVSLVARASGASAGAARAAADFRTATASSARAAAAIATGAAASAADDAATDIWASVEADRKWLEKGLESSLVDQALWLIDVRGNDRYMANMPIWARTPFDKMDKSGFVKGRLWGLWLQWYRAILPNSPRLAPQSLFGERLDIEIATQPSEFWGGDPDEVVNKIATMFGLSSPSRTTNVAVEDVRQKLEASGSILAEGAHKLAEQAKQIRASSNSEAEQSVPIPRRAGKPLGNSRRISKTQKPVASKPQPRETVRTLSDEPTPVDQLGRRPFAQALAERIDDVRMQGAPDGFAVHLHAPWGAGKTSVLMMMDELMIDRARGAGKRWAVVHFNAWKNERRKPPWWPLIQQTYKCCSDSLWKDGNYRRWLSLKIRWMCWRLVADWFPYIVASLVFLLLVYFWWFWGSSPEEPERGGWLGYLKQLANGEMPWAAIPLPAKASWFEIIIDLFGKIVAFFTVLAAAFATFVAVGRAVVFGSPNNAKFYSDLSADPLSRITRLFRSVVRRTGKPVAIFIDDLDRCDIDYVVDLLEGIQTLFRGQDVAYVVAADRAWIKAAFEKRYDAFKADVGDAGQPLGYLFLEKIFQVSTPIPGMGARVKEAYWRGLIQDDSTLQVDAVLVGRADKADPKAASIMADKVAVQQFDKRVATMRQELRTETDGNVTAASVDRFIGERGDAPEVRAAAALEINVSRAAEREAEHLLGRFKDIVGEVPRVMKRMINAFAMRRSMDILEGSAIPRDTLVRWTILEQRWPALADLLIEKPDRLDVLTAKLSPARLGKLELEMRPFANLKSLQLVIGKNAEALTADRVGAITHGSTNTSREASFTPGQTRAKLSKQRASSFR